MNNAIEINKELVAKNIKLASNNKKACLMVKANCYGLGMQGVQLLIDLGYDFFGVSTLEEALEIRSLSDKVEILIVSYVDEDDLDIVFNNNITITVYDMQLLQAIDKKIKFHLNFDTNMGRIGFFKHQIKDVIEILEQKQITPEGIYTHLACASDEMKTLKVIDDFKEIVDSFKSFNIPYIHLFNSFGAVNYECEYDNMVRIGIGIWGYFATQKEFELSKQKYMPALSIQLKISNVKSYNGYLSYDHIEAVKGIVYTITAGYRDGIYRRLNNYEIPEIGKIVGKINMCQFMVLAQSDKYQKGDCITFVKGSDMYDMCEYADITTYEYLTALSSRYKIKIK